MYLVWKKQNQIHVHAYGFVCLDTFRPINNFSVIKGQVFLSLTSTKLGLHAYCKQAKHQMLRPACAMYRLV